LNKSQYEPCDNATVSTHSLTDDDISVGEEFRNIEIESGTVPKTLLEQYALFDSGATAHFLVQGAPVINKKPVVKPLKIKLPEGNFIESTHTCNLDIPWLPTNVTEAHIVPGLQHSSLISTRKFCDAGCKVIFETEECKVFYKNELVLSGIRDEATGLWKVPINPIRDNKTILPHLDLYLPHHTDEQLHHIWRQMCTLYHSNNNS
jgi:hypothetical protein